MTSLVNADGTDTFSYDNLGRVTGSTDPLGNVTSYGYDNLSRLIERTDPDPDGAGSLTSPVTPWAYNANGQVTSVTDPLNRTTGYGYDNLGRLTTVTLPDPDGAGSQTSPVYTYAYNAAAVGNVLTGGNSVEEKRVDFAYNALGQFSATTRYADLAGSDLVATTEYTFDSAHRLTALSHENGSTVLADYAWAYDTAGRVTSTVNADGTDTFSYDDNGQLTATDSDYQTDQNYSYDANGNRTNSGHDTGDNNRLLSDGTYDYEYDAEGNRTKKTEIASGDYVEYAWDHRNRLASVTFRNSSDVKTKQVVYKYDAFDRRIAKDVDDDGNGTFDRGERYVYDGSDIVLVFTDAGALTERLLYGPAVDQPLASEGGSGDVRWMLADNQGTVRDVAEYDAGQDETNVVNHLQYGSFGNITSQTNSSEEPRHTYTGREWDADAELYYYRARWYDAVVGRFISEDPIGFAGGDENLSRYVENDPVKFVDPSGLRRSLWDDLGYMLRHPFQTDLNFKIAVAQTFWDGRAKDGLYNLGVGAANTIKEVTYYFRDVGAGIYETADIMVWHVTGWGHPVHFDDWSQTALNNQPNNPDFWNNAVINALAAGDFAGTAGAGPTVNALVYYANTEDVAGTQLQLGAVAGMNLTVAGYFKGMQVGMDVAFPPNAGQLQVGATLARVSGGDSNPIGAYWTTVDPLAIPLYRAGAGLPHGNTGTAVVYGTLNSLEGVIVRPAAPGPTTPPGALMVPEVVVPSPSIVVPVEIVYPATSL